jgi:hypothetical protein
MTQKQIWGMTLYGLTGMLFGWVGGGLLESMFTGFSEPGYAGSRIGLFLGALLGGQIGAGNGRFGIAIILTMILCSAAGALLPTLWMVTQGHPILVDRLSSWHLVSILTAVAGAFVGLMLGFRGFRHWVPQSNSSI